LINLVIIQILLINLTQSRIRMRGTYGVRVEDPHHLSPFLLLHDPLETAVALDSVEELAQVQLLPLENHRTAPRPPPAMLLQEPPVLQLEGVGVARGRPLLKLVNGLQLCRKRERLQIPSKRRFPALRRDDPANPVGLNLGPDLLDESQGVPELFFRRVEDWRKRYI
jgi:hypothetical protein